MGSMNNKRAIRSLLSCLKIPKYGLKSLDKFIPCGYKLRENCPKSIAKNREIRLFLFGLKSLKLAKNRETSSLPPALNFVEVEKKTGNEFIPFCSQIRKGSQNVKKSRNKFIPFCSQNSENGQKLSHISSLLLGLKFVKKSQNRAIS